MKTFKEIYTYLIEESIKDDALQKFGDNAYAQDIINKFFNEIRHKETDSKKKDINFWLKGNFKDFKNYVENFKSNKEVKRQNKTLTEVDNGNGKLLGINDGYELWQVDSYEAAKFLGRFYKNVSAKWCISTDNEELWEDYFNIGDNRFYFLIRQVHTNDQEDKLWNKVAINIGKKDSFYNYKYWDITDNSNKKHIYKDYYDLPPYLRNILEDFKTKIVWYHNDKNDLNISLLNVIDHYINNSETEQIAVNNIKELLKQGANINYNNGEILRQAIHSQSLNIIKFLIEETNIQKKCFFYKFYFN